MELRPSMGGFFRPFGAAQFIKAFLAGRGPDYGAPKIDPEVGAPQSDIHAAYKGALLRSMAEDAAAYDAGEAIRKGKPMTPEQVEERSRFYLERIPYKLTKMRYQSFHVYFGNLKRLGWVEETGKTEPSEFQEDSPSPPASPRVFYRLTAKGRRATEGEWSDPIMALYKYSRAVRSSKKQRYYQPPQRRPGRPRLPVPPPKGVKVGVPVKERIQPPPIVTPPPKPKGRLPVAELLDKWSTAKVRNSALALKDLKSLGVQYDTSECIEALTEYRDIVRSDYSEKEDYQEARDESWGAFIERLEDLAGEEESAG